MSCHSIRKGSQGKKDPGLKRGPSNAKPSSGCVIWISTVGQSFDYLLHSGPAEPEVQFDGRCKQCSLVEEVDIYMIESRLMMVDSSTASRLTSGSGCFSFPVDSLLLPSQFCNDIVITHHSQCQHKLELPLLFLLLLLVVVDAHHHG